jgi:hypothetical protein
MVESEQERFLRYRAKAERLRQRLEDEAQNSPNVPVWVQKMINQTAKDWSVPVPPIKWRRSKINNWSSGRTFHHRIVVTAGKDRQDQKLVLLHELAHWIMKHGPEPDGWGHTAAFWRVAFDLFAEHKLIKYATSREGRNWALAKTEAKIRRGRK